MAARSGADRLHSTALGAAQATMRGQSWLQQHRTRRSTTGFDGVGLRIRRFIDRFCLGMDLLFGATQTTRKYRDN